MHNHLPAEPHRRLDQAPTHLFSHVLRWRDDASHSLMTRTSQPAAVKAMIFSASRITFRLNLVPEVLPGRRHSCEPVAHLVQKPGFLEGPSLPRLADMLLRRRDSGTYPKLGERGCPAYHDAAISGP